MKEKLNLKYNTDKKVWDECAETYEEQIVAGHPDVLAYENFEEDFLDKLLNYLAVVVNKSMQLVDVGCGSGRLHVRYSSKVKVPLLNRIKGIDFSERMLEIANKKLKDIKLFDSNRPELVFEQSSAFELQGENQEDLSIAVNLINSIGVMQGTEGAQKLFEAMRRCVEESEGIAIISCYRKEYVEQYALPQYESTLNVCGQPIWLKPKKYSSENYTLKPKYYQRANSQDLNFEVEVYEKDVLIKPNFMLYRDKEITQEVIKSGHIRTHTNYESNWYSFNQIANWINKYWDGLKTYHLPTNQIDSKNAEAGQLAILDAGNHIKEFVEKYS